MIAGKGTQSSTIKTTFLAKLFNRAEFSIYVSGFICR